MGGGICWGDYFSLLFVIRVPTMLTFRALINDGVGGIEDEVFWVVTFWAGSSFIYGIG